ncbi:MAG: prepilin-type N-terminal cleavage/methylation domain-containing protein, partial [Planctomycetota bacterium]
MLAAATGGESAVGGRRSAAGFTLAELLVVLSVIAVLAALSIAALLRLPARYEREQLLTSVRALVDRARAAAIEGGGAWLWRDRRRLVAAVWTPLVLLHGEELERGADDDAVAVRGAHGLVAGGRGIEGGPGRFGAALYFTAPGAFLDLGNAPSYSPPVGLRIALWLLPGPPEQRPLAPRPGSPEDDPDAIVRYPILEKRGE